MHAISFSLSVYSYFVRDDLASSIWFLLFASLLFCSQYLAFRMLEALVKWCKLKWDVNTYICAYPHVCTYVHPIPTHSIVRKQEYERKTSKKWKVQSFCLFCFPLFRNILASLGVCLSSYSKETVRYFCLRIYSHCRFSYPLTIENGRVRVY